MPSSDVSLNIDKETLLASYRTMRLIREFEDRVHTEFATGDIPGYVHLYLGEEAIAAGICANLNDDDYLTSTHRAHGHTLAKGVAPDLVMLELYAKKGGQSHGKGGSMHFADLSRGLLGSNGIVGASIPVACGAALSAKIRQTDQVAVALLSDGGSNQGVFYECLNLAAIWKLPCIFVVENNGYAQSTSVAYATAGTDLADRAAGFDMPGVVVDGHDFFSVYQATLDAVQRARSGDGPTLIECKVDLFCGHFEGDAEKYRPRNEAKDMRASRDCLTKFATSVVVNGAIGEEELAMVDRETRTLIDDAVTVAKGADRPDAAELLSDVYVSY